VQSARRAADLTVPALAMVGTVQIEPLPPSPASPLPPSLCSGCSPQRQPPARRARHTEPGSTIASSAPTKPWPSPASPAGLVSRSPLPPAESFHTHRWAHPGGLFHPVQPPADKQA